MKRVSNRKSRPPRADKTRVSRRTAKAAERSAGRSTPHCLSPAGRRGPALTGAGPGGGGRDGSDVAVLAADLVEENTAGLRVGGGGEGLVAGGYAGGAHEAGKFLDVVAVRRVWSGRVLGIGDAVAHEPAVGGVVGRL